MSNQYYFDLVDYYCSSFEKLISHKDKMILAAELESLYVAGVHPVFLKHRASVYMNADMFNKEKKLAQHLGIGLKN